jgi:hypothetical protein
VLAALGEHIAADVAEHEPDAVRLAGPSSERSRSPRCVRCLRASVPDRAQAAKEYGTANRLEGVFEPGERVCLVEDVVTSGAAVLEALEAGREKRAWSAESRSACSIARRAARRSRAPREPVWCAFFVQEKLLFSRENRRKTAWVERNGLTVRVRLLDRQRQGRCT